MSRGRGYKGAREGETWRFVLADAGIRMDGVKAGYARCGNSTMRDALSLTFLCEERGCWCEKNEGKYNRSNWQKTPRVSSDVFLEMELRLQTEAFKMKTRGGTEEI